MSFDPSRDTAPIAQPSGNGGREKTMETVIRDVSSTFDGSWNRPVPFEFPPFVRGEKYPKELVTEASNRLSFLKAVIREAENRLYYYPTESPAHWQEEKRRAEELLPAAVEDWEAVASLPR